VKVAFVQDLSPEGSIARVQPTRQGLQLAFGSAPEPLEVEVVPIDTQGEPDETAEAAAEIVADETFVAAFAAPELPGQADLAAALGGAGVPLLSLSGRDRVTDPRPGTWFRFVPGLEVQAEALARATVRLPASQQGVCLLRAEPDGTRFAREVERALRDADPHRVATPAAALETGCGAVVWTGDAIGGAAAAIALAGPDERPVLVGGERLHAPSYLQIAGAAAEGTVAVCPCADVSTSVDLEALRFIQDYQSQFGSPPAPYAVEAWDAGRLVADGLLEAGGGRGDLVAWLEATERVEGLGGPYGFAAGEPVEPAVPAYRVRAGRWIPVVPST
jgi:branched-chain amino acid transport system substrate-binding protein